MFALSGSYFTVVSYGTSIYRVCNFVQFKSAGEIKAMAMKIPKGASGQVSIPLKIFSLFFIANYWTEQALVSKDHTDCQKFARDSKSHEPKYFLVTRHLFALFVAVKYV